MERFDQYLIARLAIGAMVLLGANNVVNAAKFEHILNFGGKGDGPGQFEYVESFAFTGDGKILVTDAKTAWVQVFDKKTGAYLSRFGGKGNGNDNFVKPEAIAVADDGRIYVGDNETGAIKIFGSDYRHLKTFSEKGTEPGQNYKSEFPDIRNGLLYLPEEGDHRVSAFDLNGTFKFVFGTEGTGDGQFQKPVSLRFKDDNVMYVTDHNNHRLQVFSKDGKFVKSIGTKGPGPNQFDGPSGIDFDTKGNYYVGEKGNARVSVYDKNDKYVDSYGSEGSGNGQFGNIHGVLVDKTNGWVYVADTANNRVQVFAMK